MILILAVSIPFHALAMWYPNLTTNWSVEEWGDVYDWYNGYPLQVASNWTRFSSTQSDKLPRFMTDDDYADLFSASGAISREGEGSYSQNVWSGRDFVAGIYQQISSVTPNKPYAAKSWMLTVLGTDPSQTHTKMSKLVGIDPFGGTEPDSSNVVWGEIDDSNRNFVDVRTAAWAKSSTVTLFAKVISPDYIMPDWNAAWFDTLVLVEAPTVSASSPEFSASTSFTVSWNNAQAAPGGSLMGLYDVEYKDGVDGEWVPWKSKKSTTQDAFNGQLGHTYYFRARAWQQYDPEGIELYGAYSEQGDTHTTVGRVVTGYVRGNTDFAVSGVTVAISETASSTVTDSQGRYHVLLPGPGSYHLTASSSYYTPPPAVPFSVASDTFIVPITLTVRPPDDAVADGDFEGALTGPWTASGSPLPVLQNQEVRSGQKSLKLCDGAVGSSPSRVEQSFSVTGMYEPVLSFYAKVPQLSSGAHLLVGRSAPNSAPLLIIDSVHSEWTHFYVPLDVDEVHTGSLGIFFQASATSTMEVYLDEVSVGRSPGGPIKSYCPVMLKQSAP